MNMSQKQLEELLNKILADIKDAKSIDLSEYLKDTDIEELTSEEIIQMYDDLKTKSNKNNVENA